MNRDSFFISLIRLSIRLNRVDQRTDHNAKQLSIIIDYRPLITIINRCLIALIENQPAPCSIQLFNYLYFFSMITFYYLLISIFFSRNMSCSIESVKNFIRLKILARNNLYFYYLHLLPARYFYSR
jgi:hypothetical protein